MTFTIKKGQHGCKHPFIDHQATVSETRLITLDDWFTGAQPKFINKIWGYSFGHHQIDSARLGLKLLTDRVRLVTYVYANRVRLKEKFICEMEYGSTFVSGIDYSEGWWRFMVDDRMVEVSAVVRPKWGYFLFPYYGGSEPAPKNILTTIEKI